jgi:hypothetical protein
MSPPPSRLSPPSSSLPPCPLPLACVTGCQRICGTAPQAHTEGSTDTNPLHLPRTHSFRHPHRVSLSLAPFCRVVVWLPVAVLATGSSQSDGTEVKHAELGGMRTVGTPGYAHTMHARLQVATVRLVRSSPTSSGLFDPSRWQRGWADSHIADALASRCFLGHCCDYGAEQSRSIAVAWQATWTKCN